MDRSHRARDVVDISSDSDCRPQRLSRLCQKCSCTISTSNWARHQRVCTMIIAAPNDPPAQSEAPRLLLGAPPEAKPRYYLGWLMALAIFVLLFMITTSDGTLGHVFSKHLLDKFKFARLEQAFIDDSISEYVLAIEDVKRIASFAGCSLDHRSYQALNPSRLAQFLSEDEGARTKARALHDMNVALKEQALILFAPCRNHKCQCKDLASKTRMIARDIYGRGDWGSAWSYPVDFEQFYDAMPGSATPKPTKRTSDTVQSSAGAGASYPSYGDLYDKAPTS